MAKFKKNKNKPKLNLTVREEQRNKLEQTGTNGIFREPFRLQSYRDYGVMAYIALASVGEVEGSIQM